MMEHPFRQLLVIDDDADILLSAKVVLRKQFEVIYTFEHPLEVEKYKEPMHPDVILLDMNYAHGQTAGREGKYWLKRLGERYRNSSIVMITAYGDINLAVETMKEGAVDFVVKPWENKKLIATVNAAGLLAKSKQALADLSEKQNQVHQHCAPPIEKRIAHSNGMQQIEAMVNKVAPTDAHVLITGENGTGKELIARQLHARSQRGDAPFVHVDLGALTEALFESELFGHEKGAFTGAWQAKPGRLETAGCGTLFLDEVGNLPLPLQAKLLHVLQNRVFFRVGGSKPVSLHARILSATNSDLSQRIQEGRFREDLLYRLNTVTISLPPLRERIEDIAPLVHYFLKKTARKYGKAVPVISHQAHARLCAYTWPGNVRELQHVIERTLIMSERTELCATDFLLRQSASQDLLQEQSLHLETVERQTLQKALRKHNNNVTAAAKELGLGRTTLYRKMEKYDL